MTYKNILFQFILLFSFSIITVAQDTITVMQWNLLKYSSSGTTCIPIAGKTADIKTVVKYIMPDILGVNEMYPSTYEVNYLLNNALNTDGVTYYKSASITNLAGSQDIVNMLYYNFNKLGLISNTPIQVNYRDINIYKLYFKAADLATTHDTIYLNVIIAHLKASVGYESERAAMTNTLMTYLNNINIPGNYLCQGDFNLYTSTEPAYQNLIGNANANMRFYDPINSPGDWAGNYYFKNIHTQSTHTSGSCFVTGGMDDRFDFILISKNVKDSTGAKYISGSYKAIGQDGLHYNNDLTALPTNTAAPSSVINALYNTSDHLPVMLKLNISASLQSVADMNNKDLNITFNNPVVDYLKLYFESEKPSVLKVQIISILGSLLSEENIFCSPGQSDISVAFNFPKGFYLLRITDGNNKKIIRKIVKE